MKQTTRTLAKAKNIALVAHDNKKAAMLCWAKQCKNRLQQHHLFATGTTGSLLQAEGFSVTCLFSGPMGGDQQLGAMISEQQIDILIFFWDPLYSAPHDPDVKALQRLAVVWNIPLATNEATANILLNWDQIDKEFEITIPDYAHYLQNRTNNDN